MSIEGFGEELENSVEELTKALLSSDNLVAAELPSDADEFCVPLDRPQVDEQPYPIVSYETLQAVKKLPLLSAATERLKSPTARYGFSHVQKSYKGFYFCYYKGINTGVQSSPMLAAYELIKQAELKGIDITDKIEIDYYPECFYETPKVDLKAIEYLLEPSVRAMYKGIKLRTTKTSRSFVCDIVLEGIAYRTYSYPTPQEAAWAVHNGKAKVKAAVYVPGPDKSGPADLSVIQYLQEGSGYKHVNSSIDSLGNTWFRGKYSVHGVPYYTRSYRAVEEAAWAVHHAITNAPTIDSWEKKIAEQTTGMKSIKILINREYAEIKKDLLQSLGA